MSLPNSTVLITDYNYPSLAIEEKIFSAAGIRMITAQASNVQEVINAGRDVDAILNQYAPITAEVLDNLSRCRAIVRYGIGVDNIDLKAARNKSIPVANVPTYGIQEVADHTMTMTLALVRKLPQIQQLVKKGVWEGSPCRPIFEMAGQRFGLLGCGRIGQAVARRARGFDFEVIGYDPFLSDKQLLDIGIEPVDFDSLISSSDLISLHLPLNDKTHHVIDTETFQLMRDQAFLINCSRGGLVNSDALVEALQNNIIAGAALDVVEGEPIGKDHPLLSCENAIVTSHVAWYSEESMQRLQRMAAEEIVRALNGEPMLNVVNAE